jgi:U3 small nucleolar RNA-associated protein 12
VFSILKFPNQVQLGNESESTVKIKRCCLRLSRSLRLPDDVLAVSVSPDASLIAVALLDTTVRLFYTDTLAFRASLYGHALPVSAVAFSSDGTLVATGSADKTIKVWGIDFGDCHGTLRVHKEPVVALTFIPHTHLLFSGGKDGLLWFHDADNRTSVTALRGHAAPITAITISEHGGILISIGADRAIRVWERTESPLFLEEEAERKLEEQLDMQIADSLANSQLRGANSATGEGAWPVAGTAPPSLASLRHYERLLEVLELVAEDDSGRLEYETALAKQDGQSGLLGAPPPRLPLLSAFFSMYLGKSSKLPSCLIAELALTNSFLILSVILAIPTPDLQEAILLLPLHAAVFLLRHIQTWLSRHWMPFTCTSLLCLILKIHGPYLHQSSDIKSILSAIATLGLPLLARQREQVGRNTIRAKLLLS